MKQGFLKATGEYFTMLTKALRRDVRQNDVEEEKSYNWVYVTAKTVDAVKQST